MSWKLNVDQKLKKVKEECDCGEIGDYCSVGHCIAELTGVIGLLAETVEKLAKQLKEHYQNQSIHREYRR